MKRKLMSDSQLEAAVLKLPDFSADELCEIYHKANSWKWDERLGQKPNNFDNLPNFTRHNLVTTKHDYVSVILTAIKAIVSERELCKYIFCKIHGGTEAEFERFWKLKLIGDSLGVIHKEKKTIKMVDKFAR